jgi:hypothetical protein
MKGARRSIESRRLVMSQPRRPAWILGLLLATFIGAPTVLSADVGAQTPAPSKASKSTEKKKLPSAVQMVVEPRAMDLLKAASERLAAAKAMTFTAIVSYEHPSQLGPPLVYTLRYDVTMQRPDKLKVVTPGDGPSSEFSYDGKSMVAFAPAENLTAKADAPPTIDAALAQAYEKAAIYYPFGDLIVVDPYAALTEGTILAFYIGPSDVVAGVKTDMVAWANQDVFVQAWIGSEDKLPRRIRAMFAADRLALRHDMELSNWQLDPEIAPDTFASPAAQGGQPIAFANPVAMVPAGVKPIYTNTSPKKGAAAKAGTSAPKSR